MANKQDNLGVQPLSNRVVVKPEDLSVTKGGIVIPDTAKDKPGRGTIMAVGPGKVVEGKHTAMTVKAGDQVLYSRYAGTEVKIGEVQYLVMSEDDVLAIVEA